MKKIIAIMAFCASALTIQAQSKVETIKVYGNCGTCEKHIEKAAKLAGAEHADWDKDTKILKVTYDSKKTSNDAIQKKIASVGYDTEKYRGDDTAYAKLDECCQYDRKSKSN